MRPLTAVFSRITLGGQGGKRIPVHYVQVDLFILAGKKKKRPFCIFSDPVCFLQGKDQPEPVEPHSVALILPGLEERWQIVFHEVRTIRFDDVDEKRVTDVYYIPYQDAVMQPDMGFHIDVLEHFLRAPAPQHLPHEHLYVFSVSHVSALELPMTEQSEAFSEYKKLFTTVQ
jgi:hypothetical protein